MGSLQWPLDTAPQVSESRSACGLLVSTTLLIDLMQKGMQTRCTHHATPPRTRTSLHTCMSAHPDDAHTQAFTHARTHKLVCVCVRHLLSMHAHSTHMHTTPVRALKPASRQTPTCMHTWSEAPACHCSSTYCTLH